MLIPRPRGALSAQLFERMRGPLDSPRWGELDSLAPDGDDDAQIALWTTYELAYRGFDDAPDELEWHPPLLALRRRLEHDLESRLRERFVEPDEMHHAATGLGSGSTTEFAAALFGYVAGFDGPSLSGAVQRTASRDQVLGLLRDRTVYHLKEADPTAWTLPRLESRAKAGLVSVQFDEYGCGDPNRLHAELFARGVRACGLSDEYGTYVDEVPVSILEQNNAMSLFGLHRRLRGAALGHFAAFEATSSVPSRRMAQGLDRLGMPAEMVRYYDEHVEADAVHDQLAVREICAPLVAREPHLLPDVFLGAFTCLDLERRFAAERLAAWAA